MIDLLSAEFGTITEAIRAHAAQDPQRRALIEGDRVMDYAALDALMDQVASALQQAGIGQGDAIAICATMSIEYAAVFLGALRAGVVVAPLAPGSAPSSLARMVADASARLVFTDAACIDVVGPADPSSPSGAVPRIALDGSTAGQALHA